MTNDRPRSDRQGELNKVCKWLFNKQWQRKCTKIFKAPAGQSTANFNTIS